MRYVGLVLLIGLMLSGVTSSSSPDLAAQDAESTERFASIGDAPDIVTLGVVRNFAALLKVLQAHPTATDPMLFDQGGIVFTPADLVSKHRKEKPRISLSRNLEYGRDSDWTGFPNQLRIDASAPNGHSADFCVLHLTLRFTQLSPLIRGGLTPARALAALRDGPANSINFDEVETQNDAVFNSNAPAGFESTSSSSAHRDFERGRYVVAGRNDSWQPASAQDIRTVLGDLNSAVRCITTAFAKQSDPIMPSESTLAAICSMCVVTGLVPVPNSSDFRLITMLGVDITKPAATVAVLNRGGQILWRYDTVEWRELEPIRAAVDATGNLFVRYNPGRYDGVLIIGVRGNRVQTFESLPDDGSYISRFYNAIILDADHDGVLDIAVHKGFCEKSCASDTVFHWNGSTYVDR